MTKKLAADEPLSTRDKALCDGFLTGQSRPALGAAHGLTAQRVGQILHRPNAVTYLLAQAGGTRALLFAKIGAVLLDRAERGELKTADLIALWKAAMPQEIAITQTVIVRQEARRIAEELGLSVDEVLAEAQALIARVAA